MAAFDILVNEWRRMARDRTAFFFLLILPLIFTTILGLAFGGSETSDPRYPVDLVLPKGDSLAAALRTDLERSDVIRVQVVTEEQARADVSNGDVAAALIVPAGFTDQVRAGAEAAIEFVADPGRQSPQAIRPAVDAAVARLASMAQAAQMSTQLIEERIMPFAGETERRDAYNRALARAQDLWNSPPVESQVEVAGQRQSAAAATVAPGGFAQSSPGMLVLFVLITSLTAGEALVEERESGALRRLVVAPVSRREIIAGKLLGAFTLTLAQMAFLILIGQLVFRVNWGRDPVALALVVVAYALVAASFGLLMATIVRTTQQFGAMQAVIPMIMGGLGGAMWPLEIVPPAMRAIGHLVPTGWAMEGFQNIITRGLSVQAVLLPVGVLLLFAALFFVSGVRRFRFE